MKKRLLGIFLVVAMSASLIACGETSKENKVDVVSETETVEVTPEPTVIETEEPQQEIISEEKTEIVEETIVPESTDVEEAQLVEDTIESETPAYTYTDIDVTKYAKSTVNVRDLPDTSGNKVGSLSANDEIHINGQCNETGWYRFEYNGNVAYVSNGYLVDEKVEVSSPAETPSNGRNNQSNVFPYALHTVYYDANLNAKYYYVRENDNFGVYSQSVYDECKAYNDSVGLSKTIFEDTQWKESGQRVYIYYPTSHY